ncbi:MAG: L-threonylcarbamoyladenylate synthase [Defluviitaleaceae bacterium]|nr:L-threonylcarbamoyladenylate synthase [Defluviitaleaceae bacterium]
MRTVTPDKEGIDQAARLLKEGGLVAVPTETVYGLAADAFNAQAVARIYATKGRPADNPLILHIADKKTLDELAEDLPAYAYALTEKFWPGPLTLVVRKKAGLPAWLGGHPDNAAETVGVRMPNHPAVLELIRQSGCVVAAPSANKAGTPSPTCAQHIINDYDGAALTPDMLLDGGTLEVGIESTVVDTTGDEPVILRPGAVTAEMIQEMLGTANDGIRQRRALSETNERGSELHPHSHIQPRSPGIKYRHYAPLAPMTLLSGDAEAVAAYITTQIVSEVDAHIGVLVSPRVLSYINAKWPRMAVQSDTSYTPIVTALPLGDPKDLPAIARNLFANLRTFDEKGADIILAEALPSEGLGAAIMDRMTKAAEGRVIRLGITE